MKTPHPLNPGTALLGGAALMLLTLLAHPHASSLTELLRFPPGVFYLNIGAHGVGMLSVPLVLCGCWGLTTTLNTASGWVAFVTLSLGMALVVGAMTLDGLVPMSLVGLAKRSTLPVSQFGPLLAYNTVVIQSLSLVYLFATCLALLLWSLAMLRSTVFPRWTAYYGALVSVTAMVAVFNGVVLVDFIGIKIFVFGFTSWTIIMGYFLQRAAAQPITVAGNRSLIASPALV